MFVIIQLHDKDPAARLLETRLQRYLLAFLVALTLTMGLSAVGITKADKQSSDQVEGPAEKSGH
jgi:hypothetical protein